MRSRERLRTGPLFHPEHCLLPRRTVDRLGVGVGRQVRLRRGDQCALFTVAGTAGDAVVSPAGRERLGVRGPVTVEARIHAGEGDPVVGTFEEEVVEGGDRIVACAPHGGLIEPWTNRQARIVREETGATAWVCRGDWEGGGAFDRWHVTANDVHPDSFPGLGRIADRGFERAVAFHGWARPGIGVGGTAPRGLREAVRDAVAAAVPDSIDVRLVTEGPCSGTSPENVVNRLIAGDAGGVQLEQSIRARDEHSDAVAEAVAGVLASA